MRYSGGMLASLFLLLACSGSDDDTAAGAVSLADAYELPDEADFPEGFAFSPSESAFFLGSLGSGIVTRLEADGSTSVVAEASEAGWSTMGAKVHEDTGNILFCAIHMDRFEAALWVLDPATHDKTVISLGADSNCNDVVAVGSFAYLTNREARRVYRVDLDAGEATVWLDHALLEPGLIGNNGIVHLGDSLLVGQYSPATFLRIPLNDPEGIEAVDIGGDSFGTFPQGADGAIVHGDDVLVATNGGLIRLSSDDGWSTAVGTATDTPVPVCALTEAHGTVYGLKCEVVAFVLDTEPNLPFEVVALELP